MAQEALSLDPGSISGGCETHLLTSLNLPVSSLAPDSTWNPVTLKQDSRWSLGPERRQEDSGRSTDVSRDRGWNPDLRKEPPAP